MKDAEALRAENARLAEQLADVKAALEATMKENEKLREALDLAKRRVEHWRQHGEAHEERAIRERDRCDEAEKREAALRAILESR